MVKAPTVDELKRKYRGNMQKLNSDHEVVIERVLMTEESVIATHRALCDKAEEFTIK